MIIGKLIEVGVAVTNLDAASRTFATLLDARMTGRIRAPMFSMDFRMGRLEHVDFELMTPYADDSVIRRFIGRRGEGLHHVAFHVPNIDDAIAEGRARGVPFLSQEPVLLGGLRAAFLHPGCLSGLLVEFVENLHTWGTTSPDADLESAGRITGFGVAVRDVDAAASEYAAVLGAEISQRCWNETLGAHVRHASLGGIRFELLPSTASLVESAKLDRDRQGLHHVCLHVRRPEAFAAIRNHSENRASAKADSAFFTDPRACHGVMFEIHSNGHGP
jgi:methylmalonyl-CoA/ethylmalonyl-CoA epimerase